MVDEKRIKRLEEKVEWLKQESEINDMFSFMGICVAIAIFFIVIATILESYLLFMIAGFFGGFEVVFALIAIIKINKRKSWRKI